MDIDIDLDCPGCGGKLKVTAAQVSRGATVRCPRGHSIKLKDEGGGMRRAQRALDDLDKTIRDFGK